MTRERANAMRRPMRTGQVSTWWAVSSAYSACLRVLTRSGDRVENHENGCGGGAKEGERLVDRLQIEDRRPAGDQHQIGGLSCFKRGAVGVRRGIDVEHPAADLADPRDLVTQAARVSRQHYGEFRFAAVRSVGGRFQRIEVDDGGVVSGSGRNDGQVKSEVGFSGDAFPADEGDGFHRRPLHNVKSASPASLHTINSARIEEFDKPSTPERAESRQRKGGFQAGGCGRGEADPRAVAGDKRMIRQRIRGWRGSTSKRSAA